MVCAAKSVFCLLNMYFVIPVRYFSRRNVTKYLKCTAKVTTFTFWAVLYFVVMRLTIFKDTRQKIETDSFVVYDANETLKDIWPSNFEEDEQGLYNYFQNYSDEKYYAIFKEMDERNQVLHRTCGKYRLTSKATINHKEFFVAPSHRIIWCNIFKAASSAWMYNFNLIGGYTDFFLSHTRQTPLTLARLKFPRPTISELISASNVPGTLSFMFVREPFERLLSAYRDKLETHGHTYYRKLSRQIVKLYRNETQILFGKIRKKGPTFNEFVKYITMSYKTMGDQFKFDEHWCPYYKFCTPCLINFTMIGKVETYKRDTAFIAKETGLEPLLLRPIKNKRTRVKTIMNKSHDGRNTAKLLEKYFKQLDKRLLTDLLMIYKIDFEMFGYDPSIYWKYVS